MKVCIFFFRQKLFHTLDRLQHSVNITYMCTGKPQDSCDSLYGDICFIVAVWNSIHNIFKVSLYKKISHSQNKKITIDSSQMTLKYLYGESTRSTFQKMHNYKCPSPQSNSLLHITTYITFFPEYQ